MVAAFAQGGYFEDRGGSQLRAQGGSLLRAQFQQAPPSPTATRFATVQANSEEERHQWTTRLRILLQRTRGLSPSTASAVTTASRSTTDNEVPKVANSPSSQGSINSP